MCTDEAKPGSVHFLIEMVASRSSVEAQREGVDCIGD